LSCKKSVTFSNKYSSRSAVVAEKLSIGIEEYCMDYLLEKHDFVQHVNDTVAQCLTDGERLSVEFDPGKITVDGQSFTLPRLMPDSEWVALVALVENVCAVVPGVIFLYPSIG
jgi:hypothetical protein